MRTAVRKAYEDARVESGLTTALNRQRLYGITVEAQGDLLASQDGLCAGCGDPRVEDFHLDHDHKTGQVRGFLCKRCNSILGLAGDDPGRLYDLAEYLNAAQRTRLRKA